MELFDLMTATLGANLLTVFFVWGMVTYSRKEREGTAGDNASWIPLAALMVPMLFLAGGLMITLDKVPGWLDAALQ